MVRELWEVTGNVYVNHIGLKGQIVTVNLQLQFSNLDTLHILGQFLATLYSFHCRRNGSNLFQITADAHPGMSGVSKDQKFCEKFKNSHCQVDHPAKIE